MKKWIALLLAAALMLSGCQITIVNPFATAPSTEPSSEAYMTEPSATSTETTDQAPTEDTAAASDQYTDAHTEWGTMGHCVDCGIHIHDPAGFDPYHCVGCGDSSFFGCVHCGKRIPGVMAIRRMCVDCYWASGSAGGHCVLCGGALDVRVANGIVCYACYGKHGDNIDQVILQPLAQACSVCNQVTTCGGYLVNGNFACVPCGGQSVPLGGAICDICGLPYAEGEGFEWLCFDCQEKYGTKCSVCGTDCTYRGTIDGMCDDCYDRMCYYCGRRGLREDQMKGVYCLECIENTFWYCGVCGDRLPENIGVPNQCEKCTYCGICGKIAYSGGDWINGVFTCPSCMEKEQTDECAQCGRECVGTWVGTYYVCDTCAQKRPCPLCGKYYYVWDMFEGVCFDCDDPSGGMADMEYCITCGTVLYEGRNYDGYCYYCSPNFGFTCSQCGQDQPLHKPASGLCPSCEAGDFS